MNALDEGNIYRDNGSVDIVAIRVIEKTLGVKLPSAYIEFITKHNGARLERDYFNYCDINTKHQNSDSIAFYDVTEILWIERTDLLNSLEYDREIELYSREHGREVDKVIYHPYFEKGLVPFGGNGGGDSICFDYRNDPMEWPPVVFWSHDVWGDSERVSFIANTFEEFMEMLHEPEELV